MNSHRWRFILSLSTSYMLMSTPLYLNVSVFIVHSEWLPLHRYDPLWLVTGRAAHCWGSGSELRDHHTLRGAQQNQWHGYGCQTFTSPLVNLTFRPNGKRTWQMALLNVLQSYSYENETSAVLPALWRNLLIKLEKKLAEASPELRINVQIMKSTGNFQ